MYQDLACEDIMFEGQVDFPKRINLNYDDVERHYHAIVNITGTMAKRFMCKACNKSARLKPHTAVTRHVVILWLGLRAPSPPSEFPPPNVIDIIIR